MNDKNKLVITTVAIAIVLIAAVMMVSATITLKGPSDLGVVANPNTTLDDGWNTTVAQKCEWLNFSANTTYNNSMVNITFPAGFVINSTALLDDTKVVLTNFTNITAATNITQVGQTIVIYNSSATNITANHSIYSAVFWINLSVGSTGALTSINHTTGTHTIDIGGNWTADNNPLAGGYDEPNTTYLTVYNMRNVTATIIPSAVKTNTVGDVNFTITNTDPGFVVNNLSISILTGRFSGNKSDVYLPAGVGTVSTTPTLINITNANITAGSAYVVNVSNINASASITFAVNVYNQSEDGSWRAIYSPPTLTAEAGYGGTPDKLEVQFNYGNWTVGDAAVPITVQSHDTDGNLTNATSHVFLKITSDNQYYANLLPADGIVHLVNGTNSSATINVTDATQYGVYRVTAYDLNETDPEMDTATDSINYTLGTAGAATKYALTSNVTGDEQDVGKTVMVNITFKDDNDQSTSSIDKTGMKVIVTSDNANAPIYSISNASYTYPGQTESEDLVDLEYVDSGVMINFTTKSDTVATYNFTVEIKQGITSKFGSPKYIEITFKKGDVEDANITSPANYTDLAAGGRVPIFVQAITSGSANLNQADLQANFNVSGTGTTAGAGTSWENAIFSQYGSFALTRINATHVTTTTNESGIAVVYLNVSTKEGAIHNVTASIKTHSDTVNITTVNSTKYKLNLTSDEDTAQISGEADPSYNWVNLTATITDQYGNQVEEPGIVIGFSDGDDRAGYGIFNATSATTGSSGNATVKYRSAKRGGFTVTATNNTELTVKSDTTTVKFYGPPATVKAVATLVSTNTVNTSINVTIGVYDSDGNAYERLSTIQKYVNVSVDTSYSSSSAGIYNETGGALNVTGNWAENTVSVSLTNGKGYLLINDTKAESVVVQVWSTGLEAVYPLLTSVNKTLIFTTGALSTLDVTSTASSVTYGENIKLKIAAHDKYGNVNTSSQADLMPVKLQFNETTVSVSSNTLSDSSTGVNESNMPYILGRLTNGIASVTITSSTACGVNATASTTALGVTDGGKDVVFESLPWTTINVATNRNAIVKNGTDYALINISLLDAQGNLDTDPTTSDSITVETTGGNGQLNRTTTIALTEFGANGYLNNVSLTATAGPITVYASNATIMSSVNATVDVAGYAAAFAVTPSSTTVDVNSNITLTVNLTDLNGNPVSFAGDFTVYVNNVSAAGAVLYNRSIRAPSVNGTTSLLTGGNGTIVLKGIDAGTVKISVNSTSFGGTIESVNVTTITVTSAGYNAYTKDTSKLKLYSGWNFISVPKKLAISADTFGELGIIFDATSYTYNASTGNWSTLTNASKLEPLEGYWVTVASQGSYTLTYKAAEMMVPPSKQLYAGWNAIGLTSEDATMANLTLQSVTDKWSSVIGWNAVNQTYQTSLIKGATSGVHSEGNTMEPGQGYWVWMTADGELAAISA